jgi:hypothetical protein
LGSAVNGSKEVVDNDNAASAAEGEVDAGAEGMTNWTSFALPWLTRLTSSD